jgi:hypothetical protein
MPVTETAVLEITCDNPSCPGNELDPADRMGWTFVSSEVYGEPTQQHVYCSPECAETIGQVLREGALDVAPL